MKTKTAEKFKSRCLKLLNEVQTKGETIVLIKRGKPIASLSPIRKDADDFFGFMKGKVTIVGDIVSPLPPKDWGISDDLLRHP